jgi:hypothetical protein
MDRVEQMKKIQSEALELFTKKNIDYGDAFAKYGVIGVLHRPKRKMRQTFYKKIKNRSVNLFGDINALLKSIILFDDYNQLRL